MRTFEALSNGLLAFAAQALVVGVVAPGLSVLPRVLATTVALTPVMTYVALPRMTRAMAWWLAGEPPPWRRAS